MSSSALLSAPDGSQSSLSTTSRSCHSTDAPVDVSSPSLLRTSVFPPRLFSPLTSSHSRPPPADRTHSSLSTASRSRHSTGAPVDASSSALLSAPDGSQSSLSSHVFFLLPPVLSVLCSSPVSLPQLGSSALLSAPSAPLLIFLSSHAAWSSLPILRFPSRPPALAPVFAPFVHMSSSSSSSAHRPPPSALSPLAARRSPLWFPFSLLSVVDSAPLSLPQVSVAHCSLRGCRPSPLDPPPAFVVQSFFPGVSISMPFCLLWVTPCPLHSPSRSLLTFSIPCLHPLPTLFMPSLTGHVPHTPPQHPPLAIM